MNQPIPTPTPPLAVAVNDFYFSLKVIGCNWEAGSLTAQPIDRIQVKPLRLRLLINRSVWLCRAHHKAQYDFLRSLVLPNQLSKTQKYYIYCPKKSRKILKFEKLDEANVLSLFCLMNDPHVKIVSWLYPLIYWSINRVIVSALEVSPSVPHGIACVTVRYCMLKA